MAPSAKRSTPDGAAPEGIHLFTFGGIASAAQWANALLAAAPLPAS